jgi:hypothetical protein
VSRVRFRALRPFTILAIGWVIGIIYAYPGVMTLDGNTQLQQARDNFYTDGHPPAMALLWRQVDRIIAGPFGMLVIQTVAFVTGLYWILRRTLSPQAAARWTVALFLFPPVLSPMACVWKDSMMAGFFLLGVSLLLDERRRAHYLGLGCLMVATAMRYNAPGATLPLVLLLFRWFEARTWRLRIANWGIALVAWIAITAIPFAANAALTDQKMYLWDALAVFDIAGTIAHVDEPLSDDELRAQLAGTELQADHDLQATIRARYLPDDVDRLLVEGGLWKLPLLGTTPAPEPQRDAIARAFREIVGAHLGAYVRHRIDCFAEVIGLTSRNPGRLVRGHHNQYEGALQSQKLASGASHTQARLEHWVSWLAVHTPLFRAWIYLAIAICLLPLGWRQGDIVALLASGIFMEGTLLPLAATPDYRYSHWLVVCTLISAVVLGARRMRA